MRNKNAAILLVALALAGCGAGHGFGFGKSKQPDVIVNSNLYPASYRTQIVGMLQTLLTSRADYSALISPPMLRPVPDSSNDHYVVCLQFNNDPDGPKTKVVLFLGGEPQQYVDATPEECTGAAYQPFTELAAAIPHK